MDAMSQSRTGIRPFEDLDRSRVSRPGEYLRYSHMAWVYTCTYEGVPRDDKAALTAFPIWVEPPRQKFVALIAYGNYAFFL